MKKENELKKQFFNVKKELKPIAPLFASFESYKFVMNHINDAFILSNLHEYFQSHDNIGSVDNRLKAIGEVYFSKRKLYGNSKKAIKNSNLKEC